MLYDEKNGVQNYRKGKKNVTYDKIFLGLVMERLCFVLLPQINFPANDLNFHWRWRWWDWIQAIFLNLFYFIEFKSLHKILLQLFYGNKANSNKTLRKSKKGLVRTAFETFEINLWNWEISHFTFAWYLKISLFTFTS